MSTCLLFTGLFHDVPVEVPLSIANAVIGDYSENCADTWTRYLTTLLLKHLPLLRVGGQRRRWINLTVHNLGELVFVQPIIVAYVSKQVAD